MGASAARKETDEGSDCGSAVPSVSGVDRLIPVMKGSDATGAFFGGGVDRFQENFESQFFVLFCHFRETGLIHGKPFFPTFSFEFFFPGHREPRLGDQV